MGEIQKITCKKCGNSWNCKTGCGIMHGKLEAVLQEFDYGKRDEELMSILADLQTDTQPHSPVLYDFAYCVTDCHSCRKVISVPVLTILEKGQTYVGCCPECGAQMFPAQKITCPVCRGRKLEVEQIGLWD